MQTLRALLSNFNRALYYECEYQRARSGWPVTRAWVNGCVPILANAPGTPHFGQPGSPHFVAA